VPASGAASRMFKALFSFLDAIEVSVGVLCFVLLLFFSVCECNAHQFTSPHQDEENGEQTLNQLIEQGKPKELKTFFDQLHSFAFFDDLNRVVNGGVDAALVSVEELCRNQ
jgi:hypothetical protein